MFLFEREGLPFRLEQKSYLVLASQLIRRTACFLFALHCSAILQKSPGIALNLARVAPYLRSTITINNVQHENQLGPRGFGIPVFPTNSGVAVE